MDTQHQWCIYSVIFLLLACLGGMHGYDTVSTDLGALRYDVAHCLDHEDESAVAWPVVGRFKSQTGVFDCLMMIPIIGTTQPGIKFFSWAQHFLDRLATEGYGDRWACKRPNGNQAKAADYQTNIFTKLRNIQDTTNLINQEYKI